MKNYKAWILDFDGTLSRQMPVRIFMAIWLAGYYFFHPWRLKEIFILMNWRKLREERFCADKKNFRKLQLEEVSRRYKISISSIEKILNTWLIEHPLKILLFCVRRKLLNAAKNYQRRDVKMIVYSDNPVKEKLIAIDFFPDASFSADELCCMKPDVHGLKKILAEFKLNPTDVLYIGDRDDRDGICAKAAGIDYLDVKKFEELL